MGKWGGRWLWLLVWLHLSPGMAREWRLPGRHVSAACVRPGRLAEQLSLRR